MSLNRHIRLLLPHDGYIFSACVYIIYNVVRAQSRALVALSRASQLPSRSKLSISIGYNDALVYNYWILWRTAGYIAAPDLKGKKKRSCMKVATAMSGKERSAAFSRPLYRRTLDSRSLAIYVELLRQLFFYKFVGSIASYRIVCHVYRLTNKCTIYFIMSFLETFNFH